MCFVNRAMLINSIDGKWNQKAAELDKVKKLLTGTAECKKLVLGLCN